MASTFLTMAIALKADATKKEEASDDVTNALVVGISITYGCWRARSSAPMPTSLEFRWPLNLAGEAVDMLVTCRPDKEMLVVWPEKGLSG